MGELLTTFTILYREANPPEKAQVLQMLAEGSYSK